MLPDGQIDGGSRKAASTGTLSLRMAAGVRVYSVQVAPVLERVLNLQPATGFISSLIVPTPQGMQRLTECDEHDGFTGWTADYCTTPSGKPATSLEEDTGDGHSARETFLLAGNALDEAVLKLTLRTGVHRVWAGIGQPSVVNPANQVTVADSATPGVTTNVFGEEHRGTYDGAEPSWRTGRADQNIGKLTDVQADLLITAGTATEDTALAWVAVAFNDVDTDNDGLLNSVERKLGTNPLDGDSDRDGLGDQEEVLYVFKNATVFDAAGLPPATDATWGEFLSRMALDADTDDDGLLDGEETLVDADFDGLPNALDMDSDHDRLLDCLEAGVSKDGPFIVRPVDGEFVVLNNLPPAGAYRNARGTDVTFLKMFDFEAMRFGVTYGYVDDNLDVGVQPQVFDQDNTSTTDPYQRDTDGDGFSDGGLMSIDGIQLRGEDHNADGLWDRTNSGTQATVTYNETDPANIDSVPGGGSINPFPKDTDNDGLPDFMEFNIGTDKEHRDSDNDGLSDFEEFSGARYGTSMDTVDANSPRFETNPLDPDSDKDGLPDGLELGRTMGISDHGIYKGTDTSISDDYAASGSGWDGNHADWTTVVAGLTQQQLDELTFEFEDEDEVTRIYPRFIADADSDDLRTRTHPLEWDTNFDERPDGFQDKNRNGAYLLGGIPEANEEDAVIGWYGVQYALNPVGLTPAAFTIPLLAEDQVHLLDYEIVAFNFGSSEDSYALRAEPHGSLLIRPNNISRISHGQVVNIELESTRKELKGSLIADSNYLGQKGMSSGSIDKDFESWEIFEIGIQNWVNAKTRLYSAGPGAVTTFYEPRFPLNRISYYEGDGETKPGLIQRMLGVPWTIGGNGEGSSPFGTVTVNSIYYPQLKVYFAASTLSQRRTRFGEVLSGEINAYEKHDMPASSFEMELSPNGKYMTTGCATKEDVEAIIPKIDDLGWWTYDGGLDVVFVSKYANAEWWDIPGDVLRNFVQAREAEGESFNPPPDGRSWPRYEIHGQALGGESSVHLATGRNIREGDHVVVVTDLAFNNSVKRLTTGIRGDGFDYLDTPHEMHHYGNNGNGVGLSPKTEERVAIQSGAITLAHELGHVIVDSIKAVAVYDGFVEGRGLHWDDRNSFHRNKLMRNFGPDQTWLYNEYSIGIDLEYDWHRVAPTVEEIPDYIYIGYPEERELFRDEIERKWGALAIPFP